MKINKMVCTQGNKFEKMSSAKFRPFYSGHRLLNTVYGYLLPYYFRKLRSHTILHEESGWHMTDDIIKCIFLNENILISIKISIFFLKGQFDIKPESIQVMTWRWLSDKSLSEPVMIQYMPCLHVAWRIYLTWPILVQLMTCPSFSEFESNEMLFV